MSQLIFIYRYEWIFADSGFYVVILISAISQMLMKTLYVDVYVANMFWSQMMQAAYTYMQTDNLNVVSKKPKLSETVSCV